MRNLILYTCLITIFGFSNLNAQGFLGGELNRSISSPSKLASLWIILYTEDFPCHSAAVNWGDGTIDTLIASFWYTDSKGAFRSEFFSYHTYDDFGNYEVQINTTGFWAEGIKNLDDSHTIPFILSEEIELEEEFYNQPPFFLVDHSSVYVNEEGMVYHDLIASDLDGDSTSLAFNEIGQEGYLLPEATEYLYCCIFWKRPLESGKYAFAVRATDWDNGQVLSSTTRFMTIKIDHSMLVTSKILSEESLFSILPNPTTHTLNLRFEGLQADGATLTIQNTAGKLLHREELALPSGLQRHQVDVSSWPPGVYFLRLQAGGRQVVRRFVKTG